MAVPIFGVLGESTITTADTTTTVYTAPSGRGARGRILFASETGGENIGQAWRIGMPGSETNWVRVTTSGIDAFSGIASTASMKVVDLAMIEASLGGTIVAEGGADRAMILPFSTEFLLSPGDVVQHSKEGGQAPLDLICQFIGIEYDSA